MLQVLSWARGIADRARREQCLQIHERGRGCAAGVQGGERTRL